MSQYNIQTDSSDKPMAWGGTDLGGSKLHSIVWERIVLDEAHKIKGRTTNVAKAIFALRSAYKWCLSGTPLQNNVGELWALVRFLKMHPYAYYFCKSKGCDCRMESWPFRNHRAQVPELQFFNSSRMEQVSFQWYLGPSGSGANDHFHGHAFNVLVHGAKRWFLTPYVHPP